MAARRPFWKWHRWKSIGFCLWPPSTCIWNLKLKFQSKLDLCSGNHVVYRQTDTCLREHMHWLLFVYIEHQLDTFCLLDIPNNPVCWTCLYWLLKSHYAKYPFGHGCSPCVREMAVHPLPTVLIAHSKVFPLVASWPVRNGCLVNRHRGEIFHYHGHVISHSETTRC